MPTQPYNSAKKTLQEILWELSKENAELKAENVKLKEEMTELEEKFLTLNGKSYSYYTTLQEIKTIAEKLMADNLCNNCDGIGLDANCQDTGCPYYQMDKILQKITKAEV